MNELYFMDLINRWGYWCIFTGVLLEGLTVPFPGAFFVVVAGALVVKLKLSIWGIIFYASLGYTAGSLLPYLAARLGGSCVLNRYGRYIFLTPRILQVAEFWFQKYGKWVVCLSRPFFIGNYISYLAGLTKMKLAPFLFYTIMGILPWCGVLGYVGFYFGQAGLALIKAYSGYALISLPILVGMFYGLKTIFLRGRLFVKLKLS